MDEMLEYGRKVLKNQPLSEHLGTELTSFSKGEVEMILPIREYHKQQHGFVHGGVLSYLADNALTYAGGSVLGDVVTLEYKINYVRPAIGQTLVARATILSNGKTTAICECKIEAIENEQKKLVAVAQGTIYRIE